MTANSVPFLCWLCGHVNNRKLSECAVVTSQFLLLVNWTVEKCFVTVKKSYNNSDRKKSDIFCSVYLQTSFHTEPNYQQTMQVWRIWYYEDVTILRQLRLYKTKALIKLDILSRHVRSQYSTRKVKLLSLCIDELDYIFWTSWRNLRTNSGILNMC